MEIICSSKQTKKWRLEQSWYKNGKSNECEKYQINIIKKITNIPFSKTERRLNMETNTMNNRRNPLNQNDGFEWTENFDGIQNLGDYILLYNLKFICDDGGAQTRTLREVYHFIKVQIKYLESNKDTNIYFINILDGNTSYKHINKFLYLKSKNSIRSRIFIGSMKNFYDNFSLR